MNFHEMKQIDLILDLNEKQIRGYQNEARNELSNQGRYEECDKKSESIFVFARVGARHKT